MSAFKRSIQRGLLISGLLILAILIFVVPAMPAASQRGDSSTPLFGLGMIGVVFLFFILPQLGSLRLLSEATMTVPGRITGTEEVITANDHDRTVEVIDYVVDGTHYKLKGRFYGKRSPDGQVIVHYIPDKPKRAWAEAADQ